MKNLIFASFITTLSLSLIGCLSAPTRSGSLPVLTNKLSAPADDFQAFYAVGEGKNEASQRDDALAKIAARILVTVQATTETNLQVNTYQGKEVISDSFKREVISKAKEIEFVGVEILKQTPNASLISVNRAALALSYQNKLEQTHSQLAKNLENLATISLFEQLKTQPILQAQTAQILSDLSVMQAIQPQFNSGKYGEISLQTQQTIQEQNQQAVFKIISDQNSASLAKVLEQQLTQEGFRLGKNANISLQLTTDAKPLSVKTTDARIAKLTMADRTSSIKVFDQNQQLVGQKTLKTRGVSADNFASAVQDSAPYSREFSDKTFVEFINQ